MGIYGMDKTGKLIPIELEKAAIDVLFPSEKNEEIERLKRRVAELENQSQWISVKDEKPEFDKERVYNMLGLGKGIDGILISVCYYNESEGRWCENLMGMPSSEIMTHYIKEPLPKLPN